jgi:DNA polymerase III delta prime subunit
MESFLIVTRNKSEAKIYTSDLLKEKKVDPLDINLQTYEKIMGIEDVRKIQKKALLRPFRGKTKAIVIEAYENITLEAQNALLKILEEPPANTIIAITISKKELILPTIISRCKIITLYDKEVELTKDEILKLDNNLDILLNSKIGDRLKIAQDIAADKENLYSWFKAINISMKNKLLKDGNNPKYLNFLKGLQKTYKTIESTNVSHRTALENLFLSF